MYFIKLVNSQDTFFFQLVFCYEMFSFLFLYHNEMKLSGTENVKYTKNSEFNIIPRKQQYDLFNIFYNKLIDRY